MKKLLLSCVVLFALLPQAWAQNYPVYSSDSPPTEGTDCNSFPGIIFKADDGSQFYCGAVDGKWHRRNPRDWGGAPGGWDYFVGDTDNDGTYEVLDRNGAEVDVTPDAGAAIDYAIDHVSPDGGTVVLETGRTFTYSSTIPTFEPNNTSWVRVVGYGATIKPSASAPMAFYFHKVADGDSFDYWMIEGLTIDASSVTGKYAMIGGYNNGSHIDKVSYRHFILRDLEFLNLTSDSTTATHLGAIGLTLRTSAGTDVEISNGYVENIRIFGGNWGVHLNGNVSSEAPYKTVKHIVVKNVLQDMRPPGYESWDVGFGSTTVHVGNRAKYVEDILIDGVTCYANGDNCVEIDQVMTGHVSHIVAYNPKSYGITVANQEALDDPASQNIAIDNVTVVITETRDVSFGFAIGLSDDNPMGTVSVSNLNYVVKGPLTVPDTAGWGSAFTAVGNFRRIMLDNVSYTVDEVTFDDSGGNSKYPYGISLRLQEYDWSGDGNPDPCIVSINGYSYLFRGKELSTGGGNLHPRGILLSGDMDLLLTNMSAHFDAMDGYLYRVVGIYGGNSDAGTVRGVVAGYAMDVVGNVGSKWLTWTVGGHLDDVVFSDIVDNGISYHFDAGDTIIYGMTTDTYDADEDDTVDLAEGIRSASGSEIDSDADGNAEVKVSADGTLSFDGKLQIGDADSTANAFCKTRLSSGILLRDADCDDTQDTGEICEAAGGQDYDCDGTAERVFNMIWMKSNIGAGQSAYNTVSDWNTGTQYHYMPHDAVIKEFRCRMNESVTAGTIQFWVKVYDSYGYTSLDHDTGLTVTLSTAQAKGEAVSTTSCTDCTVDAGDFVRVYYTSSSDYADEGSDYNADVTCELIYAEEVN